VIVGHKLDLAINLDVPRDIVLDRLAGRRVCESCQRVYHVNLPPESNWTCDTCGGRVVQRDDDTEEAIDRRLQLYEEQTVPIIEYYRQRGCSAEVSGVGAGDEVFKRLVTAVDKRRPAVVLRKSPTRSRSCGAPVGWSRRCTRRACSRPSRGDDRRSRCGSPSRAGIAGVRGRTSSGITASPHGVHLAQRGHRARDPGRPRDRRRRHRVDRLRGDHRGLAW